MLGPQGPQITAKLASLKDPTILDFLHAIHQKHNVNYTYAWWRGSAYALWLWLGASILLISGALPVTINLTVYGTLSRPRRIKEPSIDLSKVAAKPDPAPQSTDQDHSRLEELERELEEKLTSASSSPSSATPAAATSARIPKLSATQTQADHKEFAIKPDDFYPTERHY
jgi:hypothetical protein